jgi:hypothetical protein
MSDAPTTAERYQRAAHSSNLKVTPEEKRGDVDYLIAAGWVSDSLGAMLYRLVGEFDAVRAEVRQGALNQTERLLILSRLKTLTATKQALGSLAIQHATRKKFMKPDADVLKIVGRALDVFLDPVCHHCEGRGFNGGEYRGETKAICRPCRGSGRRNHAIGKDDEERRFASFLLADMDRMTESAGVEMRQALRMGGK